MTPRLKTIYDKEILPKLMAKLNYKNKHQAPKVTKVVLNIGLGEDASDTKKVKACQDDLTLIAGQKAVVTKYKKSISNFKTRKGYPAGVKVTLRSTKMYEFIDRLVNIALPRIKDFRGYSKKSFDGQGNITIGIKDHIIFPEISVENVENIFGFDITIATSATNDKEGYELLKLMNFPFLN